jgi:hypothetical protein
MPADVFTSVIRRCCNALRLIDDRLIQIASVQGVLRFQVAQHQHTRQDWHAHSMAGNLKHASEKGANEY